MSYVEVFGNTITDLLHGGAEVGSWHGVAARAVLRGDAAVPVDDVGTAEKMLREADGAKRKAATAMNERSSRAHTVIVLVLTQTKRNGVVVKSQLSLADLGGSEQLKRSKAEGERLREEVNINLGLLIL
jgi:kinesin family protein 5